MHRDSATDAAYRHCLQRAAAHYENFPVASRLLPGRLRGPIAAIYCFARDADDLADEDPRPAAQRRQALRSLQQRILTLGAPEVETDLQWHALADAVQRFELPRQPFLDLADAFLQDLEKTRYADFGEVIAYCRRSANPVGRLLLHLAGAATPANLARSDAVCSALQLINFCQDLHQDYAEHGRIYLPADEMAEYGVTEDHLRDGISDIRIRRLMQRQYRRADRLLRSGAPLGHALRGRLGLEIRAIINAGARVLWRLEQQDDVFSRPRLRRRDQWVILRHSLFPPRRRPAPR
ncbi:Phytoene synthase [Thioalkalivibrio nitratireducens DSM 14787]|uniref:Phytoene synthase n=1 Tax=Thioalkalivibrio nitratireducens (strain DSM 14787 / UNIQEM 213 / ALEN2) TaxID=1255043 RepID=L0DVZ6_THIND|nr:squalene synthase HpnC [Thioalkalivibrio nitratireducens]AGA33187.1 Phytoene synthase [Thioalkalivibrio nitratireducens DSM 14787]